MDLVDRTPFSPLVFESVSPAGEPFQVVAVRGTFDIEPGKILRPNPEQLPIVAADEYRADPQTSSLRSANDLAPWKPNSDIIINATAHSPGGKPARLWTVDVEVGRKRLALQATGPCSWIHGLAGWRLAGPEPCETTPVIYEHAFGGQWKNEKGAGVFEENPVGVGYVDRKHLDTSRPLPAPRILAVDETPPALGQTTPPRGLGAIAPAWISRRKHAGTYDDKWTQTRAPALPEDFHFDFYNAAHPDLVYDGYLKGDEPVRLRGLWEGGDLSFGLPGFELGAVLTDRTGYHFASMAELDTLQIDVDTLQAFLVWRIAAPLLGDPLERIELKMKTPAPSG